VTPDPPLSLAIPAAGALFDGHFPGRPILPAVGLLHLALHALATDGAPPVLRGIASLRLRHIVVPGERLDLHVGAVVPNGRARLEVRRAAEIVARAIVLLGDQPSAGAAAPPVPAVNPASALRCAGALPELDDLLPHRPPMRLVEAIESATDDGVVCAVRLPEGCVFNERGTAPALVTLEMAAQSAAACEALQRARRGGAAGPRLGYLVGARDVRFAGARVPVGEPLLASVRLTGIALPLCTYDFEVARNSEVVASGTLSTWLTATGA